MKRGLGEDIDPKDFVELVKKWDEEDNAGTPWVEDVSFLSVFFVIA